MRLQPASLWHHPRRKLASAFRFILAILSTLPLCWSRSTRRQACALGARLPPRQMIEKVALLVSLTLICELFSCPVVARSKAHTPIAWQSLLTVAMR